MSWKHLKGRPKSAEHRAKIAAAHRGKTVSAETRARMSAAKQGKPGRTLTDAERAALVAASTGRVVGLETREKMRAAKLKNPTRYWLGKARGPQSESWRRAIGDSRRGIGHSAESKERIRQSRIGGVGHFKGRHHTDSAKERIRQANRGRSPKHGFRVEYGGIVFRSTFEARVARALDALGVRWQYEAYRFDFGAFTYAPDFFLIDDGCFWEVKGWYGPDSRRKVERFRAELPDVPIVVFDEQCIEALEAQVRAAA